MSKSDGVTESLQIFDTISQRELDILKVALIDCCADTHMPELYEIFGKEAFLRFLDVFSGATIVCPPREVLHRCIRNVGIYLRIDGALDGSKSQLIRDLAAKYKLTQGVVMRIYVDMEARLKRYQIR